LKKIILVIIFSFISLTAVPQIIQHFRMYDDVMVTFDIPVKYSSSNKTIIILYALPNGNTTGQTMGKKIQEGEDWHFNIQHIKAQTAFIRKELKRKNIVVAYLENNYNSWPLWNTKHAGCLTEVQHIVDTIFSNFSSKEKVIYLSGHSGGGRFIFDYLDGVKTIPGYIERISFLDSDYGYDASYLLKLKTWLQTNKKAMLNVFAYNDSVALLNGKRFVSDTGGTWYRSHLMLTDLSKIFLFKKVRDDSLIVYRSNDNKAQFFLKTNPEKKIFHTVQVELNGFIHSVLMGTKRESKRYAYFGQRAYNDLIQ
jgi:hypothetical protein